MYKTEVMAALGTILTAEETLIESGGVPQSGGTSIGCGTADAGSAGCGGTSPGTAGEGGGIGINPTGTGTRKAEDGATAGSGGGGDPTGGTLGSGCGGWLSSGTTGGTGSSINGSGQGSSSSR